MGQHGPLPYLRYCGVEIANAARTVEYLRNGLGDGGGRWELGPGELCSVLYRADGLSSGCSPATFVAPASDPAPWHDADEPGSDTFLGLILLDIEGYDSTLWRPISQRGGRFGGGVFGGPTRRPREWKFRAAMISADDAGAEYGLRWLTRVLAQSDCDACGSCDLTVRLACPPADCSDDSLGEWTSYDVALLDGPRETKKWAPGAPPDTLAGCRYVVEVEWTMAAANSLLYKQPVECFDVVLVQQTDCTDICDFLFGDPEGDAECCTVEPPQRGTLGAVFELHSAYGFGSVYLEAYTECPGSGGSEEAALRIQVSEIPAGSTVVVDSARRRVTVTDANGDISDGQHLLVLEEGAGIEWLEVRDCDDLTCLCARPALPCAQGTVDVVLHTQIREG